MDRHTVTNKLIHASLWTALNSYLFFIINFFGQIILAKLLIPEDYGIYAFSFALVEICAMLLGFSNATAFINSEGSQTDFDACVKLNAIAALIFLCFGVAGFFIISIIEHAYTPGIIFLLLCISQIFWLISTVFASPLQKQLKFKKVSFYQGLCSSFGLLVAIVFATQHFTYWCLVMRDLFSYFSFAVITYFFSPFEIRRSFLYAKTKEQFRFGVNTTISRALELLYYRFPDILIKLTLGKFILGNFYQARSVSSYAIKLMEPLTQQVLFSFFTDIKNDLDFMSNRLNWINLIITRAFLPFVFFAFLYGKSIFILVYGKQWSLAGNYFEYFSTWIPIASLFGAGLSTCYSLKKQSVVSISYFISALLFISGIFLLSKRIPPPSIFTLSLAAGYAYLIYSLRKMGLTLSFIVPFLLPIIILMLSLSIFAITNQFFAIFCFLVLYGSLLFYEKEKIKSIYRRLFYAAKSY